ncbi:uncharacterized protein LOC143057057 [Mytilus galloprovincialis]|uniref:uncharacterized protein LOC143057057 n=1 Tax=Mytilus galloprovincialis TaxID=29158 RepID=UPI003F7B992A
MRPRGLDDWMKTITEFRNEIFHLSDIQEMTDHKFNFIWKGLEGSIMGIANLLPNNQPNGIQRKIEIVKLLEVFSDQEVKNERLCRDYWKCKCAEFEREEMKAYTELCKSMSEMYEEVVHEIETLNTTVDKIRINVFGSDDVTQICVPQDTQTTVEDQNTVPVLLQLEVPSIWSTAKIIKAVEKLRLSDNSGSDLKIKAFSRDELNIHVDVVKEVLRKAGKFFTGITKLMTDILTTAKVKTDEVAEVKINLRLPKSKETLNAAGGQTLRNVFRSDDVTNTSESTVYTEDHVEDVDKPNVNEFGSDGKTQISEPLDTPTIIKETLNTAVDKPIIKEFTSDNVTQKLEAQDKLTQKEDVDKPIVIEFGNDGETQISEPLDTPITIKETLNTAVDKPIIKEFTSDNVTQKLEAQDKLTQKEEIVNKSVAKTIINKYGGVGATWKFEQQETQNTVEENLYETVDKTLINEFGSDDATQLHEQQDTPTTEEENLNEADNKMNEFGSEGATRLYEQNTPPNTEEGIQI